MKKSKINTVVCQELSHSRMNVQPACSNSYNNGKILHEATGLTKPPLEQRRQRLQLFSFSLGEHFRGPEYRNWYTT